MDLERNLNRLNKVARRADRVAAAYDDLLESFPPPSNKDRVSLAYVRFYEFMLTEQDTFIKGLVESNIEDETVLRFLASMESKLTELEDLLNITKE